MAKDTCLSRMAVGAAIGAAVGSAVGVMYGSVEAIRIKVPGVEKIRFVGRRTVGSAGVFSLFLCAGSLIHCGKSY